jgi:hypothetical protein
MASNRENEIFLISWHFSSVSSPGKFALILTGTHSAKMFMFARKLVALA